MNKKSFLGSYILLSILSVCISIILAILKLSGHVSFGWGWVLSPIWGIIVLEVVIISFVFGIIGIKAFIDNKKHRWITRDVYD